MNRFLTIQVKILTSSIGNYLIAGLGKISGVFISPAIDLVKEGF